MVVCSSVFTCGGLRADEQAGAGALPQAEGPGQEVCKEGPRGEAGQEEEVKCSLGATLNKTLFVHPVSVYVGTCIGPALWFPVTRK
ncbi:unnamed protein product [Ixodes pacificus]